MKLPPMVGTPLLTLVAATILGISAAFFATTAWRSQLQQVGPGGASLSGPVSAQQRSQPRPNVRSITDRNLFDVRTSDPSRTSSVTAEAPVNLGDLTLIGTIISPTPTALLKIKDKIDKFQIDQRVPKTGRIIAIGRNRVEMRLLSGKRVVLVPPEKSETKSPARKVSRRAPARKPGAKSYGISSLGENRWLIPRQAAEQVRGNMSTILQQARLVPRVVRGETIGFSIVRTGPLLQQLGLRRGDVLQQVNGLTLDSPDKALQIFTQLQEARNITLSLKRGQQQLSYDYEVR